MTAGSRERALRRLDGGMAAAALAALAALIAEHGFQPGPAAVDALHYLAGGCALAFGALQAAKLLVVPDPRGYLATHLLDFSLLLVLALQAAIHLGLRGTPEFRYLEERGLGSPLSAFYVAVLQVYLLLIVVLRSPRFHRLLIRMRLAPVQMLVASFAVLIAGGALVLSLPGAAASGRSIGLMDALFTSTSAVCVTGLVLHDTGTTFSGLGLAAIGLLIQAGGLGILTLTASVAIFGGAGMRREERIAIARALQLEDPHRLRAEFGRILAATCAIEVAGAGALWLLWREVVPDPFARAAWAAFHSVSAFCNAGFALFRDHASLTAFTSDAGTCLVIGALIVLGGLGFPVLVQLGARLVRRRPGDLTRHSRWALGATACLIAVGAAGFALAERAGALADLRAPEAALAAVFQSITLRTAGFNTVALGGLGLPAVTLCVVLMLIGGSPASTAGGMKTTTALAALSLLVRRPFLDGRTRLRAARLAFLFLGAWGLVAGALALSEGTFDRRIAFEAASALATVGLTMDYTPLLGTAGKLVLVVAMFAGRVGPFALAALLLPRLEEVPARERAEILLG